MGGKDGSPGGGVPASELWWRIPSAILAVAAGIAALLLIAHVVTSGTVWLVTGQWVPFGGVFRT